MEPRIKHDKLLLPEAMAAAQALSAQTRKGGLPARTQYLVHLRASQINGCSFCVDMHSRELKEAGEEEQRLWAVAAWRDSPLFNEAERAALALTEAATRLSDRADPVPDEVWAEAARRFEEPALAQLVLNIAIINFWNRLTVTTRQMPVKR